jgi:hypothetical protein
MAFVFGALTLGGCWAMLGGELSKSALTGGDGGTDTPSEPDGSTDEVLAAPDGDAGVVDSNALPPWDAWTGDSPPPIVSQSRLAAATDTACALRDGGIWCWGSDTTDAPLLGDPHPDAGDGGVATIPAPQRRWANDGLTLQYAFGAKSDVACRVASDPAASTDCWGRFDHGRIGVATAPQHDIAHQALSLQDGSAMSSAVEVAVGGSFSCARGPSWPGVYCWGVHLAHDDFGFGQLTREYDGTTPSMAYSDHAILVKSLATARHVAVGAYHGCAVLGDGRVACWGGNDYRQAGAAKSNRCTRDDGGTSVDCVDMPTTIDDPNLYNITQLALGTHHSCALRWDRTVWCWGRNANLELGSKLTNADLCAAQPTTIGTAPSEACTATPTRVDRPDVQFVQIAAGDANTCGIGKDTHVYCWGPNDHRILGRGDVGDSLPMPVEVDTQPGVPLAGVNDIGVGGHFAIALTYDPTVRELLYQWGNQPDGVTTSRGARSLTWGP